MSSNYQSAAEKQKAVREAVFPALESVEQVYQDVTYTVKYKSEEFNSVCPKTGLPDFAALEIEYQPDKYLVELKSLKLYLNAFRNVGVFQEHAANKVFQDFWKAANPRYLKVTMTFGARGGIDTRVEVEQRRVEMLGFSGPLQYLDQVGGTTASDLDLRPFCK